MLKHKSSAFGLTTTATNINEKLLIPNEMQFNAKSYEMKLHLCSSKLRKYKLV